MPDRFYTPVSFETPLVELSREESQHLVSVLRKEPGDVVEIFDGRGQAAEAVVESAGKRAASVRVLRKIDSSSSTLARIELATAVPKGDRATWLIEKATELGADVWTPLRLTRSVVDPGDGKLDKLRQTVITACKQCGRNQLLEIGVTQAWTQWLAEAAQRGPVLVAHPNGEAVSQIAIPQLDVGEHIHVAIAVGPEGGFADQEIAAATRSGARLINLGPHILRIETAAIAALSWLRLASCR